MYTFYTEETLNKVEATTLTTIALITLRLTDLIPKNAPISVIQRTYHIKQKLLYTLISVLICLHVTQNLFGYDPSRKVL